METVVEAQRSEICDICGQLYPAGTRITLDRRTGRWVMADCVWPAKRTQIKARPHLPSPQKSPQDTAMEVAERFDIAVEIICRKFNMDQKQVNPDSYVLAEILRQLYGQQWLAKEIKWR